MTKSSFGRPSDPIMQSGLKFDHFQSPFYVYDIDRHHDPRHRPLEFISIPDALDYAIRTHQRTGHDFTVMDRRAELIYAIES